MTFNKFKLFYLSVFALLFATYACSEDELEMSTNFVSSDSYAEFSNDTKVELSTFRLDSVRTSGQRLIWVGKCSKPVIGDIHSESYAKLAEPYRTNGFPGYYWAQNGKEVYDSVTIVLRHTGAYEGDTMKPINIEVSRLATELKFAENEYSFYNRRWFRDSIVIGNYTFTPRPHTRPRIRFRLNDEFGEDLVRFIQSTTSLSSGVITQRFKQFLGGIKIYSGNKCEPQSLLAFNADSLKIILHSHLRQMEAVKQHRVFAITNSSLQFNHVWNDNVDEPFDQLTERYHQVSESKGQLHSVEFEGLGYYTRINFPNIRSMQSIATEGHIVKANLKIYPERGSYDHRRIPKQFYLQVVNRGNVTQNIVTTNGSRPAVGTLVYNIFDLDEVYYNVDLTYYLNTVLAEGNVDDFEGLALTWGTEMKPTNYEFMVFNGHGKSQYRTVLELYYYNYNREDR